MSIEPIIAFFLLWDIRKILRGSGVVTEWDKNLKLAMFAVVRLFLFDTFLPVEKVTMWIWHLLLIAIIATIYFNSVFNAARSLMFAVLPFIIISLFSDLFKLILDEDYRVIDNMVCYRDQSGYFKVFYKGKIYTMESYYPEKYQVQYNSIAYVNRIGMLRLFTEGEIYDVTNAQLEDWQLTYDVMKYQVGKNMFRIYYKGMEYSD